MRSTYWGQNLCLRNIFWFSVIAFFSCALPGMALAQAGSGPDPGVYTSEQAEAGPNFEKNWISTTTMDDLFFLMRTTMPLSMAKSLSADQHAAVFAYVLKENGYPAGNTSVQADTPQLKTMRVLTRLPNSRAGRGPDPLFVLPDPKNVPPEPPPAFISGEAKNIPTGGGPTQEQLNAAVRSGHDCLYNTHDYYVPWGVM